MGDFDPLIQVRDESPMEYHSVYFWILTLVCYLDFFQEQNNKDSKQLS